MQAGRCSKHAEPRAATSCRLDLAHPGAERLRTLVSRWRPSPGRSVVVHLSPRSISVAASRGVCDRPRRGASRRSQPGTASSARSVVGRRGPDRSVGPRPAQLGVTSGLVPGGRSAGRRRTVVSPADLRRRGADRFRPVAGSPGCHTNRPTNRPTVLMRAVHWYQRAVDGRPSPCRFTPTCSAYALEALHLHGNGRGLWLTLGRLVRCRPFGPSGWDPVPTPGAAFVHLHPIDETRSMRKRRRA